MSFYLTHAQKLREVHDLQNARIIEELYCAKVRLEKLVLTVSAELDLALKQVEYLQQEFRDETGVGPLAFPPDLIAPSLDTVEQWGQPPETIEEKEEKAFRVVPAGSAAALNYLTIEEKEEKVFQVALTKKEEKALRVALTKSATILNFLKK